MAASILILRKILLALCLGKYFTNTYFAWLRSHSTYMYMYVYMYMYMYVPSKYMYIQRGAQWTSGTS